MKNRQRNLRLSTWLMLALMIGSILSPTISLANTVESTTSSEEQTEKTLQTLSSDPLLPESTTESTTASSEMETVEHSAEAVEPVITYGAETIDENELKLHEDQKNPQPSIKDRKIEQTEDRVYFSGKLFAGVEETDETRSTTTATSFDLQRKASSGEWETVKEWLEQDVAIQEEDYSFETEVSLAEDEVSEFRYAVKYKVDALDREDQSLIEEKNDQGYFLVEDEYSYKFEESESKESTNNSPKEALLSDEFQKGKEAIAGTSMSDEPVVSNEQMSKWTSIPKSKEETKCKSFYSDFGIQPFAFNAFDHEISGSAVEWSQATGVFSAYSATFTKTGLDSVAVSGQIKADRSPMGPPSNPYSIYQGSWIKEIYILYRLQGSSSWQRGSLLWSGNVENQIVTFSGSQGSLALGNTYEFGIGVNYLVTGQHTAGPGWDGNRSGWKAATAGGTITFPSPIVVNPPQASNLTKSSAEIKGSFTGTPDSGVRGHVRYRITGTSAWTTTKLNVVDWNNGGYSVNLTGLQTGQQYDVQVGLVQYGSVIWSTAIGKFTTLLTVNAPDQSADGSRQLRGTGTYVYSTAANGAGDYSSNKQYVQYRKKGTSAWITSTNGIIINRVPKNYSFSLTGLTPGTTYDVRVGMTNSSNVTSWSNAKEFTTKLELSSPSVKANTLTKNSVIMTGKYDYTNANAIMSKVRNKYWNVEGSSAGNAAPSAVSYYNGVYEYPLTSLLPNTKYETTCNLSNAGGTADAPNKTKFTTLMGLTGAITNPTHSTADLTGLFETSGNAYSGFKIEIKKNSSGTYSDVTSAFTVTNNPTISNYSGQFVGLDSNTVYDVRIKVKNQSGVEEEVKLAFSTYADVKEEFHDLTGAHIKTNPIRISNGASHSVTPANTFTHSSQAYIYKGWIKGTDWNGTAMPMPISLMKTGPVDPLTTHNEVVYLIYDLDSNSLRLDEYPNKFDFGNQHRPESYNQIFNLDASKYASIEPTDGFKLRVRDDRATHPGWKLTSTFSQLVGVNNTSDQLVGAKISFGVELKEIQNPGTPGETAITPTPAIAPSFGAPVSSSTATLTADGTALTFLSASNTKGEGVWDVLIDFDSVKLFVPAGQGNTGEEYQGTIQWDLEDTP
ncbi:WxL domain-containing protein [Candidatus Enterococcus ferrettii]|uniref:Fibronectin type-III domain-containing protein n=1 Tax=Candidatus Enterococcus ferrettii TaxID=2815324 RepID=A0ABV0EUX9_9ENTE|nr:WxL domain-containing protein [Enterococcus sp. 665A]MBO1343021.1 WxL domain-containing protein [Enterococcus sp. 665A]